MVVLQVWFVKQGLVDVNTIRFKHCFFRFIKYFKSVRKVETIDGVQEGLNLLFLFITVKIM